MKEFAHEQTDQTFKTYRLPNVFRTRFMDKCQLAEELGGKQGKGQGFSQDSVGSGGSYPSIDEIGDT